MDKNEIFILKKMRYNLLIGKNDKYEHAILRGFPANRHKELRNALHDLVKSGLVMSRPKPHGIKYSLNPRLIELIDNMIEEAID